MCADIDDTLGAVIAGGAGARVGGADKGRMPLCGRRLIEHVLEGLRPQCDRVLIVANRGLDEYASYAPVIHDVGNGHAGPLAGLCATFGFLAVNRHALPRWLLTVPVDCPNPPRDLATRLRAALTGDTTACCAFARHAGKAQPLFSMYRLDDDAASWATSADSALHEHGSAWRWHAAMDAIAVDFDDTDEAFHNLNTRDAFLEYERLHDRN